MASVCKFFDEDVVYKINKKKCIDVGLVLENSEFISSDEDQSDDGSYPDWERMKKGHVRVAWHPKGAEEVLPERKVQLFDRSLMPGDVVRKVIKGKDTQLGYCRNTIIKADVQVIGTKQVVSGVDSKDLIPMEEFSADISVFKDSWIGMVKSVKTELTLRCQDGSRCLMSDIEAFDMDDVLDQRDRTSEFRKYSFYPGQQLRGPAYCFEKVKWIVLNKSMEEAIPFHSLPFNSVPMSKSIRATVEDVKVVSVGVQWLCKAYSEEANRGTESEHPKYTVTGDDLASLKMLNIFEPCTLQIGDRNYLIFKEGYHKLSTEEWKGRMSAGLNIPGSPPPKPKEEVEEEVMCNGKEENDSDFESVEEESSDAGSVTSHSTASSVESRSRSKKKSLKKGPSLATRVLKKRRVVRKKVAKPVMQEALLNPGNKLVTEALVTETKSDVVWQDGSVEVDIPSTSLYPVHHLDSHEFFPGDYVIDNKESRPHEYGVVKKVDHTGRTALVTWMKTYHAGADPHPDVLSEEEVSVYDIKDHPDFKYRPGSCVIRVANFEDAFPESTAGQVVDVHPSGRVEVSWVSGKVSLCYPQELYRVGEYDSDDLWGDDDSFGDEEDSWETQSENSLIGPEETTLEKDIEGSARDLEKFRLEEEKSTEDMQEKLLANIEKLRAGMARLEEVFTQNPTLQTCNVMRRLLELYKHCKVLDQLLGTTYFHERHLQSLIERLKHRGRVNSIQHMADQILRLFSTGDNEPKEERVDIWIESPLGEAQPSGEEPKKPLLSPMSPTPVEPRNICQYLCAVLKSRLLKAHEDAEMRFSMSHSATSAMLEPQQLQPPAQDEPLPTEVDATCQGHFSMLSSVPDHHKYKLSIFQPSDPCAFFRIVRKEMNLLKSSLPEGIVVKSFEDRIDLYSVLIKGPKRTPYEDGLFLFDFQLGQDYPKAPPLCHYVSYCSDRLNPNLYESGKVCVSLLGTWGGKGTEMWNTETSSLLQVIVSIQGLILVCEPYFNEAGYERQKGTQQGQENSRMYNEMVVLKLVQAMVKLVSKPPDIFKEEIAEHFATQAPKFIRRLETWLSLSEQYNAAETTAALRDAPEFPLLPASKGFCLTLRKSLAEFKQMLS